MHLSFMEQCCLPRVAQYLDGGISFESLRKFEIQPADLRPQHIYCTVSPPLPDTPKRGDPAGFSSGGAPQPSWAKLFIGPLTNDVQASVYLSRRCHKWALGPSHGTLGDSKHIIVEITSAWAEVLCRLVFRTVNPLLFFKSTVEWVQAGIESEISARMLSYLHQGPYYFFLNLGEATAWCVASHWDGWEQCGTPHAERLQQLERYAHLQITKTDLLCLNPAALVPLLRRGEQIWPGLTGTVIPQPRPGLSSIPAIDKLNKAESDLAMLSKGAGFPIMQPPRKLSRDVCRTVNGLKSCGMWWWNNLYEHADSDQLEHFLDNWERSAFFYEFRARLKQKDDVPSWEGFGLPWNALDQTQRGILYYLWSPMHIGDHFRVIERPRNYASLFKYTLRVNFARPLDEVLRDVKTKWNSLAPELVHLLGVGVPTAVSKKRATNHSKAGKVPGKWLLLEAMDQKQYLGSAGHVLPKIDKIYYNRQLAEYQTACKSAGISP